MTSRSIDGIRSRFEGRDRVGTMANVAWPSHDFASASTTEVERPGLMRENLLRF
jgi:hypothetical protein